MTTLFANLSIGSSALTTWRSAIGVTGNNIANASTDGYSRQILSISPGPTYRTAQALPIGSGVNATGLRSYFDRYTFGRTLHEESRAAFYETQQLELGALTAVYNESGSQGLTQEIDALFSAINAVAENPEGATERETVLSSAEALVNRFHTLNQALTTSLSALEGRVDASITSINDAARQVAELNEQIAVTEATGNVAGNLRDERNQQLEFLAQEAGATYSEADNGAVTVYLASRVLVQDEIANSLEIKSDASSAYSSRIFLQTSGGSTDLTQEINFGHLGGALALRDTTIPKYQSDLDNLAATLVESFNAQHVAGYGLDGQGGRSFFADLGAIAGAAGRIRLSDDLSGHPEAFAASSTAQGVPGNNVNALLLYGLSEAALVNGYQTFSENAAEQAAQVGTDTLFASSEALYQNTTVNELKSLQESVSGVSLDEEATDLVRYQAAYEAAARYIAVVQSLTQTLLQL